MTHTEPMDEKVWCNPYLVQENGGIHGNSVLHYFKESPFFDATSKNNQVYTEGLLNPLFRANIETRAAFERALARSTGVEYVVWHDPTKHDRNATMEAKDEMSMRNEVWVIMKQHRSIRNQGDPPKDHVLTPIAMYYVVGINIFQAPSISNVINGRMLTTYKTLAESFQLAMPLPLFSASRGSHYESDVQAGRQVASQKTAQASKEGTPMPDNAPQLAGPASKRAKNVLGGAGLLAESLQLALRWKDEFMDENPLVGEPGSFVMKKSMTDNTLVKPSQTVKPATPLPPPIETNVENPLMKGVKGGEKSPTTPGGTKKRKRSKAAGATTTPK